MIPCPCRAPDGHVHISCLVQHAEFTARNYQMLNEGVEADRWVSCEWCDEMYKGPVGVALAWSWWRASIEDVGRRMDVMGFLGEALCNNQLYHDAVPIFKSSALMLQHYEPFEQKGLYYLRRSLVSALVRSQDSSDDDLREAMELIKDYLMPSTRRLFGFSAGCITSERMTGILRDLMLARQRLGDPMPPPL